MSEVLYNFFVQYPVYAKHLTSIDFLLYSPFLQNVLAYKRLHFIKEIG